MSIFAAHFFFNSATFLFKMILEHYTRTSKKLSLSSLLTVLLSMGILFANADVDKAKWNEGKALFKSNCAACHNPKADGTGPALTGVTARWEGAGDFKGKTGKQWLYSWIKNVNEPVKDGYKYAVEMFNSRPVKMNVFAGQVKDDDIDKILLFVENPDAGGAPKPAEAPVAATGGEAKSEGPGASLYLFVFFLVVLVAILIGVTNKLD